MISRTRLGSLMSRRSIFLAFLVIGALLNLPPRGLVFFLLVLCQAVRLPGRARLYQAYFPYVSSYLAEHPEFCFSSVLCRAFKLSTSFVFYGFGAHREASDWIFAYGLTSASSGIAVAQLRSL